MAKKCGKCGFVNNPDNAHYCGKCGNNIAAYGHVWKTYDSSKYNTYISSGNTVISNSQLSELRKYERKAKDSFWNEVKDWFSDKWYDIGEYWEENRWPLVAAVGVFLSFVILILVKECSSSEKKPIRIEVDGKFGIGYDKDHLLVPAEYDSISDQPTGKHQWLIVDPATGLKGMAYVTDTIQNIIESKYDDIKSGSGRYSLLRTSPRTGFHAEEYEYVARDGVIINATPFNALKSVGAFNDSGMFLDKQTNGKHQLYNRSLDKIGSEFVTYSSVCSGGDDKPGSEDIFVAKGQEECVLYDLYGNILNKSPLYLVIDFSEGLAWAYINKGDYYEGRLSAIDRYGTSVFSVNAKRYSDPVAYREGIGWYRNPEGKWVAVDKKGLELFKLVANRVYPFTLGIAPVYKYVNINDSKLGFVDKTGHTVIPFKYDSSEYQPRFSRDSLLTVTLDGVQGKLHRNGTFYPGRE